MGGGLGGTNHGYGATQNDQSARAALFVYKCRYSVDVRNARTLPLPVRRCPVQSSSSSSYPFLLYLALALAHAPTLIFFFFRLLSLVLSLLVCTTSLW